MSRRTYLVFSWLGFAMPLFCGCALLASPQYLADDPIPPAVKVSVGLLCLVCAGLGVVRFVQDHRDLDEM